MPWPVHPNGLLGAQGDNDNYQISRSLRFNSDDSAYLNRTPSVEGNRKIWTWSGWMKRASISGDQIIFSAGVSDTVRTLIFFDGTSSTFFFINNTGSGYFGRYLNAAFRDTSSWYHIIVSVDTNQATSSNRIKFYINGALQASTAASGGDMPDVSTFVNNTNAHAIGRNPYDSTGHVNGYLAEINFIDGQALTPSSFGETDAITGRWKAKAYSGTYGTNGFYLKFADNSSTAALGTDSSGNGNTWTTNNFSVTAGAGNDSLVDSPTNYGSDSGLGGEIRGNYSTLNPLKTDSVFTLANGNLDFSATSSAISSFYLNASIGVSSGKWYWEVTPSNVGAGPNIAIGIRSSSDSSTSGSAGFFVSGYGYNAGGNKVDNSTSVAYGSSYTNSDIIGIALDMNAGTIVFYKNNTSQGTAFSGISGTFEPSISFTVGGVSRTIAGSANFGQRPFAYTAPTGFKALCTTNLPTPTIKKPSSYMDVVTYTGNGAVRTIGGLGFSPDLVWIKNRSIASQHVLTDSVRGTDKQLFSSLTNDEQTSNSGITSFTSSGFTLGTNIDPVGDTNSSSNLFVAWAWDEATIAGMDIVSYTGNGANRTLAHNLGVAPKMLIVKARTTAGADQGWPVWHTSIANTTYLQLNSTSATATGTDYWNSTSPTSSVFSVGTNAAVNTSADTYIAYAFAEVEGFSKFGSYTGNGSADGPFVYCGFRPRWVMIKSVMTNTNWIIFDTARSTYNQINDHLGPNTSAAENFQTNESIDATSNGFKIRNINNDINYNTYTHIFAAFAEAPFKYARAR